MTTALRTISILGALALIGWGLLISREINDARWLALLFATSSGIGSSSRPRARTSRATPTTSFLLSK